MQLIQVNWWIIVLTGLIVIALLVFLIARNRKDREELERKLNEDYHKPKESEHTEDQDDLKNT